MEIEQLNDKLSRQMISGENATISQLLLKKGAVGPAPLAHERAIFVDHFRRVEIRV